MTNKFEFGTDPVPVHAWSGDRKHLAVTRNGKTVDIMEMEGSGKKWKVKTVLDQHDLRVTGIDWAPKTDRIVTCSADRNAYVWAKNPDGSWKYMLVLLRINRAATCVKWSPEENKFAVGSGAKIISVCYYESDNDWWVAKHIKKGLRSTVTTLDWHPNNILVAAGGTDFKVRVYSGFVKEIEPKPSATPWGARMPFGQEMVSVSNSTNTGGGWIHCVRFNADGSKLAWVGHDSSLSVYDAAEGGALFKLKLKELPLLCCVWTGDNAIVGAGHTLSPLLFKKGPNGAWSLEGKLDQGKKSTAGSKFNAMHHFKNIDNQARSDTTDSVLDTIHQNQVSCIQLYSGDKSSASQFSTSAGDGSIVIWNLNS